MIRLDFLSYSINTDCFSGNKILTFGLEVSFVFSKKKKMNNEDTTMPLRKEMHVLRSLTVSFLLLK
jgi:hypothetical protein